MADNSITEAWPENWPAFQLFSDLRTQWRVGANGPTGLDYNVVFRFMDMLKVKRRERAEMIAAIKVMEREALNQIYKK